MSAKSKPVVLSGKNLKIDDIHRLIKNPHLRVGVSRSCLGAIRKSRKYIEEEAEKKVIYGTNTGFGPMASYIIDKQHLEELQKNLILGHAVGIGTPICDSYVLASMVVRLNTLVRGHSGVSPELIERLIFFINHRILPIIPEHGAVGTSGDLVQLAHIALALIGEGDVHYKGKRDSAKSVLKKLHIGGYKLKSKEGLSLINGTSVMTGIAAVHCHDAQQLFSLAVRNGALALELVQSHSDGISKLLHDLRPHNGQILVAQALRKLLGGSILLKSRRTLESVVKINSIIHKIQEDVQEIYSLRCIAQIVGPGLDTLLQSIRTTETEMNSVTDNPIVDFVNKEFLHGGNFHGEYIAVALDHLKMSLAKLSMLSERRLNFFLNERLNSKFPPFLNLKRPGLTMGLQGLQFVATSTASQNQTLSYPHSIHSIPTNADNQDVVSMGTDVALFTSKVIENTYVVLAIEAVALSQAVDFLNIQKKLSNSSKGLLALIRTAIPAIYDDRVLGDELENLIVSLKASPMINIEWAR
ncbi:MAG: aromatic amino acid ammonia-lyase [Patescibacteria group bacterium]